MGMILLRFTTYDNIHKFIISIVFEGEISKMTFVLKM